MVLSEFLNHDPRKLQRILKKANMRIEELDTQEVIQYPDELLYAIKKVTSKEISVILTELLLLENPGQVRKTQTDYSLRKALESELNYIFLAKIYQEEQSSFVRDILVEKKLFEPELPLFARFNLVGQQIYKEFLARMPKSEEFNRLRDHITKYFVLVHDHGGTILCHQDFMKRNEQIS